ncbi:PREDICTED: Fanconi anemia group M protein homolog [Priapulus caudatus]|uniref:Fanconi anemia group M protein homolog n=1 Tax=Priapulus caudatus TaxID=37621 RepID=A0ABM1EWK4_PRICU|nr:PREDICTED: Fanconi anemia group M protein homolog [Priapulus caudatus]
MSFLDKKMNAPKQRTLFEVWGQDKINPTTAGGLGEALDDDEDDLIYAEAMDQTMNQLASTSVLQGVDASDTPGFDVSAGGTWIYPTNYSMRDYQFTIVQAALFNNTLVVLPTGLGKTFIAAVIMYNYYRWYPQGKIVFMAPTRPLVAQQRKACYDVMGIPQSDTIEMTGTMASKEGTNRFCHHFCLWQLSCPVVRELHIYNKQFRMLALSATPGGDLKVVQQVLTNLLVSHVELRSDDSPDITPYTHERLVEKHVVSLGPELTALRDKYLQVVGVVVRRLSNNYVLRCNNLLSLSKFQLLRAREEFRQNPPSSLPRGQYGTVEGDFAMCTSLYHGLELLVLHGIKSFHNFLQGILEGVKSNPRTRAELMRNQAFIEIMEHVQAKYSVSSSQVDNNRASQATRAGASLAGTLASPRIYSHPKIEKLEKIVVDHFRQNQSANTRVMIFSQYRDSVAEIAAVLRRHAPTVRVMSFVGQSTASKSTKGVTQKEQMKVVREFREGGYNTIVATCVGEEGLDIGDVDLIVCYDAHKSPTRLVQRMGRTGRKRQGKIVMLVTEGKEEQTYNTSQQSKRSVHRALLAGCRGKRLMLAANPRMLPRGLTPAVHKMHMTVAIAPQEEEDEKQQRKGRRRRGGDGSRQEGRAGSANVLGLFAKKAKQEGEFLTEEELAYWGENFQVPDSDVAVLPRRPRWISLKSYSENEMDRDVSVAGKQQKLSLTEWIPWQNQLQKTGSVGHSRTTRDYVNLNTFMEVQAQLGRMSAGTSWGRMRTCTGRRWLPNINTADVLQPGERNLAGAGGEGNSSQVLARSFRRHHRVTTGPVAKVERAGAKKRRRIKTAVLSADEFKRTRR